MLGSHESSAGLEAMAQGQAREAEAGAGEPLLYLFSLPIQNYGLGLEPCSRKMAETLGTFGERSQLGGRALFAWIHHYSPHLQKRIANSTKKGATSFMFFFIFFYVLRALIQYYVQ